MVRSLTMAITPKLAGGSNFNVNFDKPFKNNSLVHQLVIKNFDNSRMHGTNVKSTAFMYSDL